MNSNQIHGEQQARLFRMLALASLCCGILVAVRLYLKWQSLPEISSWQEFVEARGATYIFLIWNLVLAWVPYFAALRFSKMHSRGSGWFSMTLCFGFWLLFLPNAPYIITDFLHFKHKPPIPLWYDLVLIFAFASTGLLLGLLSLRNMHQTLHRKFSKGFALAVILASIGLSGFGIWLGRFQRWNSWDIFTRPDVLLLDIANTLTTWHDLLRAIGISVLLSGILLIGYGLLLALMGNQTTAKS
ncbi:MAG: DUF1361 domain-containing protein [Saprospiraceae bacterium]|nr:DUF1361 domain-containing protein [Saprospiraceae bacterium]